mmetsp:Transcript_31284/g.63020  ORF Transcript_31284/g.63020 Transcript_31284/m.63020 type:complete len:377 (+) Transcript_31284:127-1257(+)|eukprot:CAMPEP_0113391790 /NCGR_PEP_ID=MMETSP0013_2-20120614/10916_1 /TAXON_ID=2843 ORGANISM="Skeletonema costatum, Strain 1716" /NCGR_SAMPLE_ID=MMETSP0013_2 /ASSEMBLY_ACC=CAM_ASM_000158 /LENGTH=376 /DNA_ID=CAMNT_0000275093 /DNA_START=125 /DNA_END=1255 /DNA_ORIENTATION=+ /assembly_acc=CAM_ASM_000158
MGGLRPSRKSTQPRLQEANDADAENVEHCSSSETPSSSTVVESTTTETLQRDAWTARGKLLLQFHDAISRAINSPEMKQKCSEVASYMSTKEEPEESSPVNHEYDAEATLIVQNKHKRDNDVRDKAVAVGFCTFALLRGVPIVRNVVARRMASASRYKFEASSSQQQLNVSRTTMQKSTHQPTSGSPNRLRKFLRLTLDVTISAAMTVLSGTFLFTPRPSAYIEDMSKLPLVEGKSVYAEVVCPPLLNEYKRTMEQYGGRWPVMTRGVEGSSSSSSSSSSSPAATVATTANSPTLTQEDVSLNIIRKFAENCSKRIKYERAILEEQNALDEQKQKKLGTVLIPRPVPEDVKVNIDEDVFFLVDDDAAKDGSACIEG